MELDLAALEQIVDRRIAASNRSDRLAAVTAVNGDGTVTIDIGGTVIPSQSALSSYAVREVGDQVLVRARSGEYVALGEIGKPMAIPAAVTVTVSDTAPPTGQGWEEVVTGQLWLKGSGAVWGKRVVAAPPPVGVTVVRDAIATVTYRGGILSQERVAEQGDYTTRGLQTGLMTLGADAWSGLAGRSAVSGTLTLHRDASRHGFTYGPVPATVYRCLADIPPGSPPSYTQPGRGMSLSLNQTGTIPLDPAWCQAFCDGTATGLVLWTANARENIQIDSATLSITTSN